MRILQHVCAVFMLRKPLIAKWHCNHLGLLGLISITCIVACGCVHTAPDYHQKDNWVILDEENNQREFDLFYIYPTMVKQDAPADMDWGENDVDTNKRVKKFVSAQTGIFAEDARIFAPFVHQAEYGRAAMAFSENWSESAMRRGIEDTKAAFNYYLNNFNQRRPFILLGHGQGAIDLYELIRSNPQINLNNNFVAAYLIGMPAKTAGEIVQDLSKNAILPAQNANDCGVIVVWNTQNHEAINYLFNRTDGYCINPLNWKTNFTPADKKENLGAFSYDTATGKYQIIDAFCGAFVDRRRGALIVDLPSDNIYDANGFMGKGVFHMNDIWFFAINLQQNMKDRVHAFKASSPAASPAITN